MEEKCISVCNINHRQYLKYKYSCTRSFTCKRKIYKASRTFSICTSSLVFCICILLVSICMSVGNNQWKIINRTNNSRFIRNCVRVFTVVALTSRQIAALSLLLAATSWLYVIDNEPSKHDHVI